MPSKPDFQNRFALLVPWTRLQPDRPGANALLMTALSYRRPARIQEDRAGVLSCRGATREGCPCEPNVARVRHARDGVTIPQRVLPSSQGVDLESAQDDRSGRDVQ